MTKHMVDLLIAKSIATFLTHTDTHNCIKNIYTLFILASMAVVSSSVSASALSLFSSTPHSTKKLIPRKCSISSSSAEASHGESKSAQNFGVSEKGKPPELPYTYSLVNPNGSSVVQFVQSTESNIERVHKFYFGFFLCAFTVEIFYYYYF